jgi:hypothetical protein
MGTFLEELAELAPHILVAQPGYLTGAGDFVASGEVLQITCQIEGESQLVRDNQAREVVSSFNAICLEFNALTVDGFRYAIPSSFPEPTINLVAVRVDPASDEDGALYETVFFP